MMVFAALTLVGLHERGVPAWAALIFTIAVMYGLALAIERLVLRPRQPARHHFVHGDVRRHLFSHRLGRASLRRQSEIDDHQGAFSARRRGRLAHPRRQGPIAEARHDGGGDRADHGLKPRVVLPEDTHRRALRAVADDHQAAQSVGFRSIKSGSSSGSPPASSRSRPEYSGARGRTCRLRCKSWRSRRCRC